MVTQILSIVIGVPLIVLGFIGWKKQKIFMLVEENKINIKKENIKEFTESIGKTYIMMGISMTMIFTIGLIDNDIYTVTAFLILSLLLIIAVVKNIRTLKKFKVGRWSKENHRYL